MNDLLTVILLGIVEGITEFLPVSSTGHLILATRLLGYDADRWAMFNVVIQLGAILAITVLYWRTVWTVLQGLLRGEAGAIRFVRNVLIGFLPAAAIGLLVHKHVEALLGNAEVVAIALTVGGVAILIVERLAKPGDVRGVADIPLPTVIAIGFIQCLAMVPGVSRSGATILGGLSLGVERRTAAEFSFFLAIPTMLGASTLEIWKNRHALSSGTGVGILDIAIGFVVAFFVALVVVRWFLNLVGKRGFGPFGWYRIVAGSAALIWLLNS
ncbi:undecaprenyl-diphosphatase [Sphingomonas gellani]|uniref:Undecaprenyl-diphosphatase n=1 Tax=Sphingomonas gellani TaxID=1166340 RepID=A0A1H8AIV3_9SPHN|nr:undecaprenyl-diphosphate phosphatase [Sphingomonas gellani]SEM69894.1 undecaprenyl-diphosphatase [Sphingomonas gellani]